MQKQKFIVVHSNPDQDAVASVWLIKRFFGGWDEADVLFVPAGETIFSFREKAPDAYSYIKDLDRAEILTADTGFGSFDHHQDNRDTCAARLIYEALVAAYEADRMGEPYEVEGVIITPKRFGKEALNRMTNHIKDIDHYREVYYSDADSDKYYFMLSEMLDGLNLVYNTTGAGDEQVISFGLSALDGIYRMMQNRIGAETEIEETEPITAETKYGTAVGYDTSNDSVLDLLQKQGNPIVVRKDPRKGYIRIKSLPDKGIDLEPVYLQLKKEDAKARWFLHSSHAMILNGSTKNPNMKPTSLSLKHIMNVIEHKLSEDKD